MQVPAEEEEKLQQLLHSQQQAGQQTLYHLPHMNLWTKLRPGVHVRTPHQTESWRPFGCIGICLCHGVHMGGTYIPSLMKHALYMASL